LAKSAHLCFVVESGTDVRLVEGLAERFDLTVLARGIKDGFEVSHRPRTDVDTVIGPPSRVRFAWLVGRWLRGRRGAFDFVLVQGYGPAALAANAASRLTGVPTAMLVCSPTEAYYRCRKVGRDPEKPFLRHELAALHVFARLNAKVGRQYIVLSRYLSDVVRGHGARGRIDVVPVYGVDTDVFKPISEPKARIRARLGLPTTGAHVFFSSRVAPEKDTTTLLRAAAKLIDRGRDLWLLHRSGGYRRFVEKAEEAGIGGRVIAGDALHPSQPLAEQYQAADLCVQASREEGLGFSPLEALACGVPVVAADVGGLRETIIAGETGWSYPVGDADALASCIGSALDDPAEAQRRAAAGRSLVHRQYDRSRALEALQGIVEAARVPAADRKPAGAPT
jgi:glycosyltransferase involved in cell wall biosynthesis